MFFLFLIAADEENFRKILTLYDKYHANMLRYARSLLRLYGDENYLPNAEDVIQAAFLKISRYIDRIDLSRSEEAVGGYLFTIVENEVSNFLSKQEKNEELDEMLINCNECDFFEEFSKKELYNNIVREIKRLDPKYSEVLWMRLIEEMSIREIAEKLGLKEQTVYTRIKRGIALVREKFKEEE